ncbi:MAG TPA: CBS domain-containing protein [Solirubrobacteraceae bacterium]|jgi:CBS domain-containing protein|nr:CBS domain-containing protein [Solirubrobacteraceae bacterium]
MMTETIQPYRGDYIRPAFRNATVADVMTPGMITCSPETPLETIAELMATHRVHAVAVGGIAANHLVWGVIDSLDLVRALRDPGAHPLADSISRQPALAIEPAALLGEAVRLMDERGASHLVVVDRDRPVGVLSTLDVAGAAAWGRR